MVYESDFYTTRRPYRTTPSYSTYTVSSGPTRQIRVLPGLGKVHVVHTYDRIVPYVGHKRLTVVTVPPKVYATRSSVLRREYDWIENKIRPWVAYSPSNRYLNSDSTVRIIYTSDPLSGLKYDFSYLPTRYYNYYRYIRPLSSYDAYWPYYSYRPLSWYYNNWYTYPLYIRPVFKSDRIQRIFDDATRLIRAQTASLLKQIHLPVPRLRSWNIKPLNRYDDFTSLPVKYSNDTYIHRLLTVSPNSKIQYATYYTEPIKKYIGKGHLSCVSYAGNQGYSRRRPLAIYEDALKNDIQLLSYYINKFRQEKAQPKEIEVPLSASRPSRIFSVHKPLEDPIAQELKDLKEARAARLAKIYESDDKPVTNVESNLKAKQKKEEARLAEERAFAEEARKKAQAQKEEAAKKAELAEEEARKKAQAEKEEAARKAEEEAKKKAQEEAERKAELERQEQLAAQAAAERAAELERQAEQARQEELARQAELEQARKLEEERIRQEEQRRLEEAKAEEERQQLLRLEEIAKQAEAEKEAELARQAEELAEIARQEAELAELERQERENAETEAAETEVSTQDDEANLPQTEDQEVVPEKEEPSEQNLEANTAETSDVFDKEPEVGEEAQQLESTEKIESVEETPENIIPETTDTQESDINDETPLVEQETEE